jgi:uncharacterized lipoprotein YajG
MTNIKCIRILPILILAGLLFGCAKSTTTATGTPAAPTPPQITAVNAVATLAASSDAGAHACAAALGNGSMSQADFNACSQVITSLATAGPQIDAELKSSDPWATQQTKIKAIIQANALAGISAHVSPTVSLVIAGLLTAANQISVAVGGPTI